MTTFRWIQVLLCLIAFYSCNEKKIVPDKESINDIGLKRGNVISCGSPDSQFGQASFETSCKSQSKQEFNLALKLLHSFEYDAAEKVFASVIDREPDCAMAYWGVAMANFHPLWTAPSAEELRKGEKAVKIAQSLPATDREKMYINAIASFYNNWQTISHYDRCLSFEKGMEKIYNQYKEEVDAAVFYALALDAAARPDDKTFSKQLKAGAILNRFYTQYPNHPGVVHYLIHTFDYPELAEKGLEAARKYASVAPSSSHALHMPSHIFTRLGLWNECIQANLASVNAAQCYAESAGIKGHWDEELHGLDYLVYAYLQTGKTDSARKLWEYLQTFKVVEPVNFKVAFAFAAIPSRYLLENGLWDKAAILSAGFEHFPWQNYPWQEAMIHFTRLMGLVHTGKSAEAVIEINAIKRNLDTLTRQKDEYKANQVNILLLTAEAWVSLRNGDKETGLSKMNQAAVLEDKTEKHPVTPGEIKPAGEWLGDMLIELNRPAEALKTYQEVLHKHPNRFNTLYGCAVAAEKSGDIKSADLYFNQLLIVSEGSSRPELAHARLVLKK